jgi:[NiFe] hydrogenase diaphorase moiety large subunit
LEATVRTVLARHANQPQALVQILRELQAEQGWLPREALMAVAQATGRTVADVEGVASFYRFLHLAPVGQYRVLFSDNITDRMLGSVALMERLCRRLGVAPGAVRADGRVSVAPCSCTGLGDQGPALLINHHQVITRLTEERVDAIADCIERQLPPAQWPAEWMQVDDQIRRADVLLGTPFAPGSALQAARALGRKARWSRSSARACAAAAAPALPPASNGSCAGMPRARSAAWSATPTKASPAPSRTGCCCAATRIWCSKA